MRKASAKKDSNIDSYINELPQIFSHEYDDYKKCYWLEFYDYVPIPTRDFIVTTIETYASKHQSK